MKYKEFKKAIRDLDLGLKVRSWLLWDEDFIIEVIDKDESALANIVKYKQSSFQINTDTLWMTDDADKRAEFAKIIMEFATTPIEEREYGPKTREKRYKIHLGDDLNLTNYGDFPPVTLDFANDGETKSPLLLWSEQELAMLMEEMPNLAWHQCLIDTKKEKKNK